MADLLELDFLQRRRRAVQQEQVSHRDCGVELQVCYDCELARECKPLRERVLAWRIGCRGREPGFRALLNLRLICNFPKGML
jgi:hypothetical protein